MNYEVKLTMKGKIPSGIEIFKFKVPEKIFNELFDQLIRLDLLKQVEKIP